MATLEAALNDLSLEATLNDLSFTKPPLIKFSAHATLPLKIYNYTSQAQYERHWTPETLVSRGLVLETTTSTIVARPMRTFFNHDANQHTVPIDDTSFSVLEKVDGSLGLWFCYRGVWMMATRGSFISSQAEEGAKMAREAGLDKKCDPKKTYCFEVVYPGNKIVVDYGQRRELVLLAVIDTATGFDEPNSALPDIAETLGIRVAKSFDGNDCDMDLLREMDLQGEEGFVIRFNETGERVKVKFANYLTLAKAGRGRENVSLSQRVLEALLKDPSDKAASLLESVPDEFHDEVKATQSDFFEKFDEASKEFDHSVIKFAKVSYRDISDKVAGKAALCKWLRMARNGSGSEDMKDSIRREYAIDVVRRKLRLEGKLKKATAKKK